MTEVVGELLRVLLDYTLIVVLQPCCDSGVQLTATRRRELGTQRFPDKWVLKIVPGCPSLLRFVKNFMPNELVQAAGPQLAAQVGEVLE